MKNIKKDYEKWLFIAPFSAIWLGLIQLSGISEVVSIETVKKIPEAVTYSVLLSLLFTKYGWKLDLFRKWLVPFPNLQGTWKGHLRSTWINPETGESVPPIPVIFTIRQTFDSFSIAMFTKESESQSQAARFIQDGDGTQRINYTYTNRSDATVRSRSEIHDGAAQLKIVESPKLMLRGEYWTSRKTTGSIKLERVSSKLVDCFVEDIETWVSDN